MRDRIDLITSFLKIYIFFQAYARFKQTQAVVGNIEYDKRGTRCQLIGKTTQAEEECGGTKTLRGDRKE